MAERRPLVVVAGEVQELPSGDSLPGGGGGGPVIVIETGDFQLDPAGDHPDRCVIVLAGSSSSGSFPFIKLPALANQPSQGYTVLAVLTVSINLGIGVMSNSEDQQYLSGSYFVRLTYVGSDYWLCDSYGPAHHLLNLDTPV